GGPYFALGMLGVTLWTLAAGLDYAAIPIPTKVLFAKFETIGYNSAVALFTLFVLSYAGYDDWLNKPWVKIVFTSVPLSNILLAWTNDWHKWFWTEFTVSPFGDNVVVFHHGPGFIWVVMTGYLMTTIMVVNLWKAARRGSELSRRQARFLFGAILLPIFSNLIYLVNIPQISGVDWTSITFSLTGILFLIALYGTQLLDIIPVARHTMIEQMRDCILVLDAQDRILDFNPAAAENFGINRDYLGNPIQTAMARWPEIIELSSLMQNSSAQTTFQHGDQLKVFDMHLTELKDARGQIYGKLIVLSDVTRRYQAEQTLERRLSEIQELHENLQQTQAQLVEQQRALAKLEEREHLGRDLHDGVGQILGYIGMQSSAAQKLLEENDIAGSQISLSKVAEAAQQANRDVRDYILELKDGRVSAGKADFFEALQEYCQHIEQAYQFKIDLRLPETLPDVLASAEVETQLTYILREALHNARKHAGVPQAALIIKVDINMIQAMVEDFGKGMGGTYSGPERRKGRHFGMGIMRSRAEQVGGTLMIDTSPSRGTRITATLPRRLGEDNLARLRILLADDHPLFIDGMRNMLVLGGVEVVGIAKDGIEAQEMTRTLKPDMIVMDIQMPRMNGLEATSKIKAEMPDVKIVILTTSTEEADLFEALRAGASGYLLKGMSPKEFMTLLGEISLGEASFSADMAAKMLEILSRPELQASPTQPRDPLAVLTDRQRDVLSLVAQGLTYKEVGQKLFLSERTVKFHMGEILKRLQLKGRRELMEFTRDKKLE
ncbi:MAG TPA: histidine kinase N-terminal 7TM domain-containing protein, partial [Anaerolineales bacterium]|nr:histidine kinase N-terminal 7TM domain-containing protein [Anaerolineales bacterium]